MPVSCHVTRRTSPPHPSCCAVYLQDLHVYDPAAMAWTDLSAAASGTPPSARGFHGLASAGGKLYVHGGLCDSGEAPRASEFRGGGGRRTRG